VGTVVGHGGGVGRVLVGRRVVFATPPGAQGTWAEYACSDVSLCLPLGSRLDDPDAVNLLANGMTAVGLIDLLNRAGHRAAVVTAAASEVGQLLNRAVRGRQPLINVVRSETQAEILRELGAEIVVDSSHEDFFEKLRSWIERTGATAAIDSVGGTMAANLLEVLPDGAELISIGRLSGESVTVDALTHLTHRQQRMTGFSIYAWLDGLSPLRRVSALRHARQLYGPTGHRTVVQHSVDLDDTVRRLPDLVTNASAGKTLITPATEESQAGIGPFGPCDG
jgi:NADPH:quinone reductase